MLMTSLKNKTSHKRLRMKNTMARRLWVVFFRVGGAGRALGRFGRDFWGGPPWGSLASGVARFWAIRGTGGAQIPKLISILSWEYVRRRVWQQRNTIFNKLLGTIFEKQYQLSCNNLDKIVENFQKSKSERFITRPLVLQSVTKNWAKFFILVYSDGWFLGFF